MVEKLKNFFKKTNPPNSEKGDYYDYKKVNEETQKEISNESKNSIKEDRDNFKKEALEKFKTRRSIRRFSNHEIPWEIIYNILEGALNAPAAGNIQNYKILVVTEKKKRYDLGKIAFQQYWLSDAPVLLIVIRDDYHLIQMYPDEGEVYSIQNTSAVIENILMLAHFYDLGACWVGAYDNDVLKERLGIPMEKRVDAIIPIGYPLEDPKISKDEMITKVYFEEYGNAKRHH